MALAAKARANNNNFNEESYYFHQIVRIRLPPEVNRILFVRNLPFKITSDELYDLFGKYGAIRQIRLGNANDTRGTAFVVYEDIFDAKAACDHLSGFNIMGRYLIVLYHQPNKTHKKKDLAAKEKELNEMKKKYGVE
ncbi:RNA-binding domain-containing protein [Neocallimastix sp. 'constans']